MTSLAVVPGDGIGPEVTREALRVLESIADPHDIAFTTTEYDLGARRYPAGGAPLRGAVLEAIRRRDGILLGAVGAPSVPSCVLERGLLLRLRFDLDHYVTLRPPKLFAGVPSPLADPGDVDFVV